MSLLTTFEAIKYIDLAKSSKFGSVQRFICTVLEVDRDTLTTYHIDKIKVLRQGSNITKAMAKSALSEDMIIRNIKKNIRNAQSSLNWIKIFVIRLHLQIILIYIRRNS